MERICKNMCKNRRDSRKVVSALLCGDVKGVMLEDSPGDCCTSLGVGLSGFTILSPEPLCTDAGKWSDVSKWPQGLCWTSEILIVVNGPAFDVGRSRCLLMGLLYSVATLLQSIFPRQGSCHSTS